MNNTPRPQGNILKNIGTNATSALNSVSNFATSTLPNAANSALNSVSDFATETIPQATNSAFNSVSDFATETIPQVANSALNSMNSMATTTLNSMSNMIPNNLLPAGNSNSGSTNYANNRNRNMNFMNNFGNTNNKSNMGNTTTKGSSSILYPFAIFIFLVAVIALALVVFKEELAEAYQHIVLSVRKLFRLDTWNLTNSAGSEITEEGTLKPDTPSDSELGFDGVETDLDRSYKKKQDEKSIVNKLLPFGTKEVFNVSSNDYNYYDAEPLCQALGAELANYDQVKEAWQHGADWCNYGWVKGQVAIYPTQKSTWEKIQNGPSDEKNACGQPGVNGGYFDNPEMRFGVNCYGVKPAQSANDERLLMENGTIPKTVAALKVDQKIQDIKQNIDMLGVLPFNGSKWSS